MITRSHVPPSWWQPIVIASLLLATVGCRDGVVDPTSGDITRGTPTIALTLTGPVGAFAMGGGAGGDHVCAIGGNGVLSCWGDNSSGQVNVPSGLGPILRVSAGGSLSCVVKADSTAACWGQVGNPSVPADLGKVAEVAPGSGHFCARRVDGSLRCWGTNTNGELNIPVDLGTVSQVTASTSYSCALTTGGTVRCWGLGTQGQTTVPMGLSDVVQIDAGTRHACAVRSDGTVACWGSNRNAFNQVVNQSVAPAGLTGVVQVAAGAWHSCARKSNGTVACWGDNANSQSTVPANLTGVVRVDAGTISTCALKADGTVTCWGRPSGIVMSAGSQEVSPGGRFACAIDAGGAVICWGLSDANQTTVPAALGPAVQVATGSSHACAVQSNGMVVCWGSNSHGQRTVPADLGSVTQIAAGSRHTCAVKSDGTVRCWGGNTSSNGQVVFGQATVPPGLTNVVQVAATHGSEHTCALRHDGSVTCWGSNTSSNGLVHYGQATVPPGLAGVTQIAAGAGHTCARKSDGTVTCWGTNQFTLNPAVTSGQATVPTGLGNVVQVATGGDHTCVLEADGSVTCWGFNGQGQTTPPSTLGTVVTLRAGGFQTCAILVSGALECWGSPTTTTYENPGPAVTPPGTDVPVTPIDPTTGAPAAATLVFASVLAGGETSVTSSTLNTPGAPTAPSSSDFKLGNPATYYEISTTAAFSGAIQICINYSAANYGNENNLTLLHGANGAWVDITDPGYPNTTTKIICGTTTSLSPFVVAETNEAPVVTAITLPAAPVPVGTMVSLSAAYTDANPTDAHTAVIDWEATTANGTASTGTVSGTTTFTAPGVYTVGITVTDEGGLSGSRSSTLDVPAYVVVYDPSAGFVTGGGWILSPSGACTWSGCAADGSTVGKATFGFVSRYRKGATAPDGNTEFHFEAGGLRFRSTSYDWLVVAGARAQYKGTGTINGSGDYGFLITAIDGGAKGGGGGSDRFRIKLWEHATGTVIYDNQRGALDDSPAATALGGGAIVIHP